MARNLLVRNKQVNFFMSIAPKNSLQRLWLLNLGLRSLHPAFFTLISRNSINKKKSQPRKDSPKYLAVLQATRELVDETGYRTLSVKAIAARAGVSRNVLYNWWDGDVKRLVEEALLPNVAEWPLPDTGSLEQDLLEFVEMSIEAMQRPNVLAGYLELAAHVVDKPEDLQRTSKKFRAPYARLLGRILQNAERRGELNRFDPDTNLDYAVLAQMVSGMVLQFSITKKPGRRKSKTVIAGSILKLIR